jgi:hypothetical protein
MRARSSIVAGGMILTLALIWPTGIVPLSSATAPDQRAGQSRQRAPTVVEVSPRGGSDGGSAAIGGAAMLGLGVGVGVASLGCVLFVRQGHHERRGFPCIRNQAHGRSYC